MTTWTLEENGGEVVVSWNRKTQRFPSEAAALKFVRERKKRADKVVKIDKDGYLSPVTRRGWRKEF